MGDDEEFESSSGTATESIRSMSLSDSDDFLSQLGESPYEVVLEEEQETVLLNRARQTVDFVDKQKRKMMTSSSKCSESSAQSRTVGESFPVGCKFSEDISYSQYFCSNPDRRKKLFNHPLGVYKEGCGLDRLRMSWGASE